MVSIMHWLVPKEEKFFELLSEQAENALEGARELKNFVDKYEKFERSERKAKAQAIKNIEHKGDEITHKIIERLNRTFITPIDKEDIHQMAVLLDDVIDLINAVALRFVLLSVERIDNYTSKLADIILSAVTELSKSILDLRKLKDMREHYVKIHSLENEADDVYHEALSELFHYHKNSIDIIKYKEIYELLEEITDKCEDVTHVIESIVVKHA
jgi:predicted phosphate transport protein (TIGR00153 family)